MLETIHNFWQPRVLTIALLALAATLTSCASDKPQTALVNDPDAQVGSSIPWNKPANWEGRGNIPGNVGGPGSGFDTSGTGGTGGY